MQKSPLVQLLWGVGPDTGARDLKSNALALLMEAVNAYECKTLEG